MILVLTPLKWELASLGPHLGPVSRQESFGDVAVSFYGGNPAGAGSFDIERFAQPIAGRFAAAVGGHGKVQFALTTQFLIRELKPSLVVCAGACGALDPKLKALDVV